MRKKTQWYLLLGVTLSVCFIINLACVQAYLINTVVWWEPAQRNPNKYYVISQWSEFGSAVTDWNNKNTHFGSVSKRSSPDDAPLTVVRYSSSTDGSCGWWLCYGQTGALAFAEIKLNDWYLTHGDASLGLPLDTSNKRKSVCAHELGHNFMLHHVGSPTVAVMRTTGSGRLVAQIWTPQTDDVNGVNANTHW